MTQLDTSIDSATEVNASGHRGSASTSLTGRVVLSVWVASIGLHAIILSVMFGVVFAFSNNNDEPIPITHAEIVGSVDVAAFTPAAPLGDSPSPQPSDALPVKIKPRNVDALADLVTVKKPALSIIGIGSRGGDFANLGLTIGGGRGPEFFGLGVAARGVRKIIYVVDRSGSMADTFEFVRDELKRSISALRRSQRFHVIFFNSRGPLESPPGHPVNAIDVHRERFFEFLDNVVPRGGTKPAAALRRAMALKPDVIYLLSDGIDFDPGLFSDLDEWNPKRRVKIYTIAYLDPTGREVLEQIAREHGGEFTFISEDDLP